MSRERSVPTEPSSTAARVHYGGRRFRPLDHPPGAETPLGRYFQQGDVVWAEFSGAGVLAGRLVGRCRPDGVLDAAYCMVSTGGQTVAGTCVSTPTLLPDGRVRLTEQWRRMDGTSGVSRIEEI